MAARSRSGSGEPDRQRRRGVLQPRPGGRAMSAGRGSSRFPPAPRRIRMLRA